MSAVADKRVATIEAVIESGDPTARAVRDAWLALDVPQCGWCQVGQLMSAIDLLAQQPEPSDADLAAITNLCRCGTYPRIRAAILAAARARREGAR
jgi:isoquinoline 1-oxidoreductase alpha subunit